MREEKRDGHFLSGQRFNAIAAMIIDLLAEITIIGLIV